MDTLKDILLEIESLENRVSDVWMNMQIVAFRHYIKNLLTILTSGDRSAQTTTIKERNLEILEAVKKKIESQDWEASEFLELLEQEYRKRNYKYLPAFSKALKW